MEAKDTVMDTYVASIFLKDPILSEGEAHLKLLKAQAEISFKAGREQGNREVYWQGFEDGGKAGIREMVEWIESVPTREIDGAEQYICTLEQWQAKKKKWGIK